MKILSGKKLIRFILICLTFLLTVLTSTYNPILYVLKQRLEKNAIPLYTPVLLHKIGMKGGIRRKDMSA